MIDFLTVIQLITSVLLIIVILLQQQGAGLGAGFGGSGGAIQSTRRGPEKMLFNVTIVLSILLFSISLAIVII